MTTSIPTVCRVTADGSLQPLMDYVISATGLMYYSDRSGDFAARVATRLSALEINDYSSYLQLLQKGQAGSIELDRLIASLTIGETHFFRHRELFRALETAVFPQLIEKNKLKCKLRIWSAGCSIGAEPYSISMLLRRRFASALHGWDIRIVGTDINRDFLARASTGQFEDWALRAVSSEERAACFSHDGKRWAVKPPFMRGVSFEYHNLASPQFSLPPNCNSAFDLILCRNVMIYFSRDVVGQAVNSLHACLAADGWLAMGHAEHNTDWFRSFRTQMCDGAILYQKQASQQAAAETHVSSLSFQPLKLAPTHSAPTHSAPTEATADTLPANVRLPLTQLPATSPTPTDQKHQALQELRSLADRGDFQQALRHCQSLQRSNTSSPSPHFYHALILQQIGDIAGSERAVKRALYLDRGYLLGHYYLGLLLQTQGQSLRAIRSFRNAIKLLLGRSPSERIADADELTAADLERLCKEHLDALEQK